jgi:hypothetical protein
MKGWLKRGSGRGYMSFEDLPDAPKQEPRLTFKEWCERSGLPYPLPLPGTPEAKALLDRICPLD